MNPETKRGGRHAVFVDPTGKRRRLVRGAGIAVGCLLASYLTIVVFGLVTGSGTPLTSWPAAKPSHREAAPPLTGEPQPRPKPSPSVSKRPTPSASSNRMAPSAHTTSTATPPATASTTTRPGRGRGNGLTKSPNPRKR